MRELALHILDLAENAIRAGAKTIAISAIADAQEDRFTVVIEDDGPGLSVPGDKACDPFFTTKPGKRTGLGLSLMRGACEQTGGDMRIDRSSMGGARITATLGLRHVDRTPLGDLPGTLAALAAANPDLDFRFRVRCGAEECRLSVRELAQQCRSEGRGAAALTRQLEERIGAACCMT